MFPRSIDKTLILCSCRRPITFKVVPGTTVRIHCECGSVITETFPEVTSDRKKIIREMISHNPTSRWDAINMEFLLDELNDLEKNIDNRNE